MLFRSTEGPIPGEIIKFFNEENALLTYILLIESIINKYVFDVYQLSENDKGKVIEKEGIPSGDYPITQEAKQAYLDWIASDTVINKNEEVISFINSLPITDETPELDDLQLLYQTNNGVEEYCENNHLNPIILWHQFKKQGVSPTQRKIGRAHV